MNSNGKLKAGIIRKPFGKLSSPAHIPVAISEAIHAASIGAATCGHCQNVFDGLTNLQSYLVEAMQSQMESKTDEPNARAN